jgi:diguanylate cyclase
MKLPAKELKIDRSFVSQVSGDADLRTIVSSTIEMGHRLGMKVVAEGVEDSESYALLLTLGCDSAQGYYMSPPLPPEAFQSWMEGRLPSRTVRMRVEADILKPQAIAS